MFAPAHVCVTNQEHHLPRYVAWNAEDHASLILVRLAVNDQLRTRVGQEILRFNIMQMKCIKM
jgi:hypothetical protein